MKSVNELYQLHSKAGKLTHENKGNLTIELLDGRKITARVKTLHFQQDVVNPATYGGIITFTADENDTVEYSYDTIKDVS